MNSEHRIVGYKPAHGSIDHLHDAAPAATTYPIIDAYGRHDGWAVSVKGNIVAFLDTDGNPKAAA